jgi:hypothetical protein
MDFDLDSMVDAAQQEVASLTGTNGDHDLSQSGLTGGATHTDDGRTGQYSNGFFADAADNFLLNPLAALTRESIAGDTGHAGDGEHRYDPTKNGGGMLNPINMATGAVEMIRGAFGADHNAEADQLDRDVQAKVRGR